MHSLSRLGIALMAVALCSAEHAFAFQAITKPCHANCTSRGNCNIELGVCECPFGFTGKPVGATPEGGRRRPAWAGRDARMHAL